MQWVIKKKRKKEIHEIKKQNNKGFTLVEFVIVIAVIAILAGVLIGTFTTVISRANQSKAVQEWKATVDEEYVEFVADEHEVPAFVNVSGKTITFKKTGTAADKALPTVTYTVGSTENVKDSATVTGDPLPSFIVLDAENIVYFIWNTNGTYAVVSTNTSLGTSASMAYSFTPGAGENDDDTLVEGALQTLTYGGVTYYGAPVTE